MRTTPRPRRTIRRSQQFWIRPLFRYSYTREAFVLRVVGRHIGPVLQIADEPSTPPRPRRRKRADDLPDGSRPDSGRLVG
jgi:hypothetical protein